MSNKKIFSLILWLVISLLAFYLEWPSSTPQVVFCDVGQGDAILIIDQFTQVVVDAGKGDQVLSCLERHLPFFDRQLELVVITHPDNDHYGGFKHLSEGYRIKKLLIDPVGKTTADFATFRESVLREIEQGAEYTMPQIGQKIIMGEKISLEVINPEVLDYDSPLFQLDTTETTLWDYLIKNEKEIKNYNDRSIALLLVIDQVEILLTGDLETQIETSLAKRGLLQDVDILKVAHHGSKTSTSQAFLSLVRPEISIISSGLKNAYGHPSPQVLESLSKIGSQIYQTSLQGDVKVIIANPNQYQIISQRSKK